MIGKRIIVMTAVGALVAAAPMSGVADDLITSQVNTFGTPGGLIDMPTAEMAPDAQLSTTVTALGSGSNFTTRTTLSFQVLPWVTTSFRYSAIDGIANSPTRPAFTTLFDRSFDVRFRLWKEKGMRPAVAVGLQDFIGTGIYSGEYIVATKSFGPRLRFSGGVGWGRFGSSGSFGSTGTRPNVLLGQGGIPTYDRWFRGPVAAFGGVTFDVTDRLSFSAEYSSDAYATEVASGSFNRKSRWNFGLGYQVSDSLRINAYSLHGDEFGANFSLALNPRKPAVIGGAEPAPLPVSPRAPGSAADLGWTADQTRTASAVSTARTLLEREGIKLHGMRLEPRRAHVQIRNTRYDMRAQAVGRTARALTRALPASVETFTITQMVEGVPTSSVTVARSDLERLENAAATDILAAAEITDGAVTGPAPVLMPDAYPRFDYGIAPYLRFSVFDADNPVRYDTGIRAKADYHFAPGWRASGSVSQRVLSNFDSLSPPGPSGQARVRSNAVFYNSSDEPVIDYLTVANYARPAKNLYSRLTVGYLEAMYAGVSGELLWKPVDSRFALGAEVNYVRPRAFDKLFGTRTRTTTTGVIPEWNGHLSAYYDVGYGFHTRVDAGRYLAGDWGATLAVDRVFANGWVIGAFATKTNVSSATFGEGSFDKGIRIEIPLSWGTGTPTLQRAGTELRSLTRDGGARLDVNGRLYDEIKETHRPHMARTWGKFWR